MTTRRQKTDPQLAALLERQARAQADFEHCYTRFRRVTNRMEKARQQLIRLARAIAKHNTEKNGGHA